MSSLRFVRDEITNKVTFMLKKEVKVPSSKHKGFEKDPKIVTTRITLPLNDFALALMAGKEVMCTVEKSEEMPSKKKGKKKK